jgi:hypothetical protein
MRRVLSKRPSPSMAIALAALFIALSGTTYAATGGNFILGQANSAGNQTSLSASVNSATPGGGKALQVSNPNTGAGAAGLGITVGANKPPLVVNANAGKATNLNADKLDGIDSSAFQRTTQPAADVACAGCVGTEDIADSAITEAKIPASDWHYIGDPGEPAFQNGWVNYDTASHNDATYQHAAYRRDVNGIIHLTGLVKNGTIGLPIFTLSGTNCPWFYQALPVISNNALARLTVQYVTPTCGVWAETGSNVWVSLDGISFRSWPLDQISLSAVAQKALRATGSYAGRTIR